MTKSQKSINNFYELSGLDRIIEEHRYYEGASIADVYDAVLQDVESMTGKPATLEIKNYVRFSLERGF